MDIRDLSSVRSAIQRVLDNHGKITHLVNNAGGQFLAPAENISSGGWKAVIDTNLNGTWNVIKSTFDLYMKDNGGTIVNVIVAMQNGFPWMSHSGAARAGVENLSKSIAVEWGIYGIRINCVSPGTIIGNGMNNYPEQIHPQVIKQYQKTNPLCRLGIESEVSAVVTFLLSPASSYVTGQTLNVDGGNILWSGHRSGKLYKHQVQAFTGYESAENAFGTEIPDIFTNAYKDYTKNSKL